ncbi:FYVE and coiled-coil domain-containing protein 1-like isoform X2 [Xiphias gladius]|nr:FYVE and coiled-coil domain-containing protein 1-like isoform X2 [Xiphias gladius]XP_039999864.1 FYVE and coiled-coil domain-containing protein 1-like isoform X2 [Xiphias gladius]
MASCSSVGDNQLQRIIRDLHDAVLELSKEHRECGEPITDDSANLHKFFYKLEYLLQFDQKEKTTFLGQRKDYWDYFCECLIKIKGANDGIRFVKSIPELKTSLGKGRAFIRYSLVHQRLADTLQQCLINQKVTSDWYYARSPFLKSHLTADIINHLYELNQIQFDVAARGYDLDADWPAFARRTLGTASPAFLWKPPSRCSSINSLVSSYSQSQAQEFLPIPDLSHSLLGELGELGEPSPCSIAENLRVELDQSELRQQELLVQVQELGKEAAELKGVVKDLQGELAAQKSSCHSVSTETQSNQEAGNQERANHLHTCREAINSELQDRLTAAENKNMELLSKLDEALKEKGQQTASYCDSAWKIQELLDKLKAAEAERLEAKREAEDRARHSERLSQELKLKDEELKNSEEKLAEVKAGAHDEREEALKRLEELQGVVGRIQGALSLKEKETGNLRAQLQDLQASLECRERQAEELKKRLQEEREEVEQRCSMSSSQNEEFEVLDLRKTLKNREKELAVSSERIKHLEEQVEKLNVEKESLSSRLTDNEVTSCDQTENTEDYKTQCSSLMEINTKLLQTVKKSEESITELTESRTALLDQLASLRASEKHLKGRVEAANMCVEAREKKLLDENLHLEDTVQKALVQKEVSDAQLKKLEHENRELLEVQLLLKKQLARTQQDLDSLTTKAAKLDKNLTVSQRSQAELLEKLQETETKLRDQTVKCGLLQARAEELESRTGELHDEKGAAESNEKMQKLHDEHQSSSLETKEAPFRLVIAEAQLELNLREVRRLREEVVELRAQLLAGTEERMKVQALQEVTEASREDLRVLAEQLRAQVEELNRRHVDEILRSREREEALIRERDGEAQARAGLAAEVIASREELNKLKLRYETLCLENSESREALHRANTETAELGVHVCMLTAENEEARLRWEGLSTRMQELEDEASQEAERLSSCMEELRQENQQLLNQLHNEGLLATKQEPQKLSKAQQDVDTVQETNQGEIQALRFQLTGQAMSYVSQLESVNQELQEVRLQLRTEQDKVVDLEKELRELKAENQRYCQQIEEKNIQMAKSENIIQQKEDEIIHLKGNLSRSEEGLAAAQRTCQEMSENLRRVTQDKHSFDLKTAAELDDLYRTKINLEERLVELIREKDALWQKTDALEFEQKLRDEETERDVNYCLGCHSQFSWWLRKYNCRLCGRPFCYYCCSNTVSTQQGGNRERCCRDCYNQHSAVVERHPQEEVTNSTPGTPFSRLLQAGRAVTGVSGTDEGYKQDDGVFDIITEEEVSGVSDSLSFATACSPGHGQQGAAQLNSSASAGDITSEDTEDLSAAVQDAEICLLKSGELTLSVHFTINEISGFGDSSRELFIKSSCYSTIPITMSSPGPTVTWTFTSEPKSIAFSVVYRESTETPLEQAKVLIPLTRCNSHKETIQGELKVRNPGEYTLIFDNSFSRFISKKVLYHLSLDKPVVYDGTDLL